MSRAAGIDPLFLEFQLAVAGRYSLDRELGRGGMGVVYLAREVQLDRFVAIKLLPPDRAYDEALRARFLREARTAAKLSHPNIIPIFAVDEVDQFVFYVMAYVDGETLGERVRSRGPLPAGEAVRVLREVAWALGHAHAQGVVHRDVKPENILLERGSGRALVTDFGIAAAIGADERPEVAGTPEYMSPEQALGHEVDARSDVYGLGATAYFACTGRPPFAGSTAVEVLAKQVATPAPALALAGASVPRRLAALVEKCLVKEPERRPGSALAVAEQLLSAMEERREVPAALRAFVKRDGRIGGLALAGLGYFGMMGIWGAAFAMGPAAGLPVGVGVVLGIPLAYFTSQARRLLRRGFVHADVGPAFEDEIGQLREELVASGVTDRPGVERAFGVGALGAATLGIGAEFATLVVPTLEPMVAPYVPLTLSAAFLMFLGRIVLRSRRPHAVAESWKRLWTGRLGKAAFALARYLGGTPQAGAATTHRATELAIGLAADELFRALPKATQRQLGDVPGLVAKLRRDATDLRAKHDELQDLLLDAGEAATGNDYADLRALRDELAERHRAVVSTLETTRLSLLRLHAGALGVDGLTTHFAEADEVSAEVRRLLEARGELEKFLRFGRVGLTPG